MLRPRMTFPVSPSSRVPFNFRFPLFQVRVIVIILNPTPVDNSALSEQVLRELETIDDDCGNQDIQVVKTEDRKAARDWGIDDTPAVVFFKNKIPNVYDGTPEKIFYSFFLPLFTEMFEVCSRCQSILLWL